jgi:hypothetical protein
MSQRGALHHPGAAATSSNSWASTMRFTSAEQSNPWHEFSTRPKRPCPRATSDFRSALAHLERRAGKARADALRARLEAIRRGDFDALDE